jgi:hypothetical protein
MSTGSFTHVAACVDDSDFAADVIRLAERVVKTGGTISVVHVLGGPPFSESVIAAIGGAFGGSPLMDNTATHREIAQALLETVCDGIPGAVPVLLDPHDADSAPDAVVRWAEDTGVDALVAAAHTGALNRALKFVGSFSGHLVHHAPCPVVLLPHGVPFHAGS